MTPYYSDGSGITLFLGDMREVAAGLEKVDVTLTDPPYSSHVHAKSMNGGGHDKAHQHGKSHEFGFDCLSPELRAFAAGEFKRLTRRWVLVFSDVESSHLWREDLAETGLEYIRTGAWIKEGTTPQFTGDRPAAGFEHIVVSHPGGRKRWNGGGSPAVWSYAVAKAKGGADLRVHTAQKPLALMLRLVELFSDPGELVLDAFCGSGTTLLACKRLGRKGIGIDNDEASCESAARRLQAEPTPLFVMESAPPPDLLTMDFAEDAA